MAEMTYQEAIRQGLREALRADPSVYLIGEDIGAYGGCYGVTSGLLEEFGPERVMDTPISESAILGSSVGAALLGKRPVAEIMYADFLPVAGDLLINQAAKLRYVLGGDARMPLTVRAPYGGGGGYSFNHSQSPESWFLNAPGLCIVMPSTPADAKGLLLSAIRCDDTVLYLEHKHLYKTLSGEVPDGAEAIPLGKGDIKRVGSDVTIVATGWMVHRALRAAAALAEQGIEAEVIDPRTIKPLDEALILSSVAKTGRLVTVCESPITGGFGSEVCAIATEKAFSSLKAPPVRLAAPDLPVPFAPAAEKLYYPDADRIAQAAAALLHA